MCRAPAKSAELMKRTRVRLIQGRVHEIQCALLEALGKRPGGE